MRNRKITAFMLCGAIGLSLLTGCGASADNGSTQTTVSETIETTEEETEADTALSIAEQGIFSAGGTTITSDGTFNPENQWEESGAGQTAHVDHANVLYQIPTENTELPMVFLHGYGQSRMGWMTTPDGREGWSTMFLRNGHSVWLIDEPHRGEAGSTSVSGEISTKTLDQRWYTQFRIGRWENGESVVNEGSQFPNDADSVDQFFRQMTPDTGMTSDMGADFDNETVARAVAATIDEVYERTGKNSILVTHSQGGGPGWTAAQYTDHIAAIVAIEPGGAPSADSEDFKAVLDKKIPVTMYFGDYIDNGDPAIQATAMWQAMRQATYDFRDAYNDQGGSCTVVDLPKEGITGNDHFMFQDLNNDVIADHIESWIQENVGNIDTYVSNANVNTADEALNTEGGDSLESGSRSAVEGFPTQTTDRAGDGSALTKEARVYLPYGYDDSDADTRYDIVYLMHGWTGNNSIFFDYDDNDALKNVLDHMIENGDIKPMSGSSWALEDQASSPEITEQTAAYLAEQVKASGHSADDFYIFTAVGSNDVAFDMVNNMVRGLLKQPDVFNDDNMDYGFQENAVHWWDAMPANLYNGLPRIFK